MHVRLAALLAIAASSFGAPLAAQTIDVRAGAVSTVSLAPGAAITVPVIVDITNAGALNIATLNASFSWNAARLRFDSLKRAPGVSWSFTNNTAAAASGVVSFNSTSSTPLASSVTLANIFLTATGGGGTRVVPAVASATSVTAQSILSSVRLSSIDVCIQQTGRWGDANGDGRVDIVDAQQTARYSVGLTVVDVVALLQRGDVNADGAVNVIDAQQIARFSVGLSAAPRVNTESHVAPAPTLLSIVPAALPAIAVGGSAQLAAAPWAGANDFSGCSAVTWQTTNGSVASVNNSGHVQGKTAGSATLTATSVDNPALHSSTMVTVGGPLVPQPDTSGLRAAASQRGVRIGAALGSVLDYSGPAFTTFQTIFNREFNVVVPDNSMKHDWIHPERNTYRFLKADLIVNWALSNGAKVRGHTLVWRIANAPWFTQGGWTPAEARTLLEEHVTTVVSHYRGKLAAWDVVNEPLCDDGTQCGGVWYNSIGPDYIEYALRAARAADPDVPLFINEFDIEYPGRKADSLYALVSRLIARGVPLDGIGFQSHFAVGQVRPQAELTATMARFAALGLKVQVTELDIRVPVPSTPAHLQQQALDYGTVVRACLAVPACNAIVMWGFSDKESWIPAAVPGWGDALPLDVNYQPKPAYNAMRAAFIGG